MEKDGITRVYLTGGGIPHVSELHPYLRIRDTIWGAPAIAILKSADFRAVYDWMAESYTFKSMPDDEEFDLSIRDWKEKHNSAAYAKVAKILEQNAGKKGLTIIIS